MTREWLCTPPHPLGLVKKQKKVTISFFAGVDIIVKYIKNISLNFEKNWSWFWSPSKTLKNRLTPYNPNFFCSFHRVFVTQNDWLELTVSTKKSVLKNMHWVPRYYQKSFQNQPSKPNQQTLTHFGWYLSKMKEKHVFFFSIYRKEWLCKGTAPRVGITQAPQHDITYNIPRCTSMG